MAYWLYRIGILLANLLPRWAIYLLADFLGITAYYLLRRKREILRSNLGIVLSGNWPRMSRIIRSIFCNYAHYYATLLQFFRLDDGDIARLIEFEGWENLEKAIEGGRGVIIVTAHLGHWDLGGAAVARRFKTNVVVEQLPSRRLFDLFTEFRTHQGMKAIDSPKALRKLYEAIDHNEVVILLGDRDLDGRGVVIPFFGRTTTMPRGAAVLARTTGAPVLPGFVIKEKSGEHYLGFIGEEIPILRSQDKKRDIELNTLRISKVIEGYIREHPESWYMFQPIWREEAR